MNLFDIIITQPIFNLLLVIFQTVGDFGLAIIIFTVVIKVLLWPITKSQLHQSKLIRKLQPELKKIKEESKGNRQLETLRMMELYRENDVKPFRSMITVFIQLPILFAIFGVVRMISNSPELIPKYTYPVFSQMSRAKEISDTNNKFSPKFLGIVDLSKSAWPINSKSSLFLLIITILSGFIQAYSIKQTLPKNSKKFKDIIKEASEGKEADQSELNQVASRQMVYILPLMMVMITVGLYGAIQFYYFISSLAQVVQQKIIYSQDSQEMIAVASESSKKRKSGESNIRRIKAKDTRR